MAEAVPGKVCSGFPSGTATNQKSIVIAIPTYKRPQSLKRLLEAIAGLETTCDVAVIVADNDAEGRQGFDLCCQEAPRYRWPLRPVIAKDRGIAQVRNVLVEEALGQPCDFIAMIDDDEWPEPRWLEEFLNVQRRTGAAVLQGSILFEYDGEGPKPVPDIRKPTGPTSMLQGAGNILIARPVLEAMTRPWFDPAFALTGGEDQDFFTRLARCGTVFAWADEARAHGETPALRRELRWVLARAYSTGNSDMRVLLKHQPGFGLLLRESGKIAAALLLSLPMAAILALSPNHRLAPLQKLCRAFGKLTAMLGARYNEYSVVHGE
jgi:GT2 family glycosyltransferase